MQEGHLLAWKYDEVTTNFKPAALLIGHFVAVHLLLVGADMLNSPLYGHVVPVNFLL